MTNYLDIAIKAAKEAGRIHRKYFRGNFKCATKSSSFDLVTCADIKAEEAVVSLIQKHLKLCKMALNYLKNYQEECNNSLNTESLIQ